MDRRDAQSVRRCLADLNQTERYVVLMFFADELTPTEIGLVLDLPALRVTDILESFRQTVARLMGSAQDAPPTIVGQRGWLRSLGSEPPRA